MVAKNAMKQDQIESEQSENIYLPEGISLAQQTNTTQKTEKSNCQC